MNQESGSINIYGELSEPMTISHSNVIIKGGVIAKIIIAITMLRQSHNCSDMGVAIMK